MRKITRDAVHAFYNDYNKSLGNTYVADGAMYLHGNKIAERVPGEGVFVCTAGWDSPTTKERLNGVLPVGMGASHAKHILYLGGMMWDGEWVRVADWTGVRLTNCRLINKDGITLEAREGDWTQDEDGTWHEGADIPDFTGTLYRECGRLPLLSDPGWQNFGCDDEAINFFRHKRLGKELFNVSAHS